MPVWFVPYDKDEQGPHHSVDAANALDMQDGNWCMVDTNGVTLRLRPAAVLNGAEWSPIEQEC